MVRGVGFEPTNPYGIAASGLRLWPCLATPAYMPRDIDIVCVKLSLIQTLLPAYGTPVQRSLCAIKAY